MQQRFYGLRWLPTVQRITVCSEDTIDSHRHERCSACTERGTYAHAKGAAAACPLTGRSRGTCSRCRQCYRLNRPSQLWTIHELILVLRSHVRRRHLPSVESSQTLNEELAWEGVRAKAMEYWSAFVTCKPPAESMIPMSSAACEALALRADIACAIAWHSL